MNLNPVLHINMKHKLKDFIQGTKLIIWFESGFFSFLITVSLQHFALMCLTPPREATWPVNIQNKKQGESCVTCSIYHSLSAPAAAVRGCVPIRPGGSVWLAEIPPDSSSPTLPQYSRERMGHFWGDGTTSQVKTHQSLWQPEKVWWGDSLLSET